MNQTLESGDLFEQTHAAWIRKHLPLYEEIWSEFIGHDGHGQPRQSYMNQGGEIAKQHEMFCQSHYSMALFLYIFDSSTKEALVYLRSNQDKPLTSDVYIRLTQSTSTFLALIGQVCDMIEAIACALKANYIRDPIAKFLTERNQAIHAARIPMGMNYAGVYFANIALREDEPGYRNRIAWSSVDPTGYRFAEDWFEQTRRDLIGKVALEVLPSVQQNCKKLFTTPKNTRPSFTSLPPATGAPAMFQAPVSGALIPPRSRG